MEELIEKETTTSELKVFTSIFDKIYGTGRKIERCFK